jgi:UDP-N-acetyl-D-galactosamine dehydrogenase
MAIFAANKVVKLMIKQGHRIEGARVLILGITFKENCPDIRNSKVMDMVRELQEFGCQVTLVDPWADPAEVHKVYGFTSVQALNPNVGIFNAIVLAVAHREFQFFPLHPHIASTTIVFDAKGVVPAGVRTARL